MARSRGAKLGGSRSLRRDLVFATSSENAENVVKPPRMPVVRNSRQTCPGSALVANQPASRRMTYPEAALVSGTHELGRILNSVHVDTRCNGRHPIHDDLRNVLPYLLRLH